MENNVARHTLAQRAVALAYGLACHAAFLMAVAAMAVSLFTGLRFGRGPFHGWSSALANGLLLATFPLSHSGLLSPAGRRFMARLVPLGIGSKISTTVFVALSSLHLLAVFACWSPSGVVWWQADPAATVLLAVLAGAGWLLLGKSMADAQLDFQLGLVGWWAVVRNRKAVYRPFSTRGLYRHVRQPIYISFALLLWLTSAWTPDQLVLALGWTAYCVAGAALKERRFLRYFGDGFRSYQREVPFWIPRLRRKVAGTQTPVHDTDTIIVGGGPVGLLLASLLGRRGLRVLVVERRTRPVAGSMAIGITPPSLNILKTIGLDGAFSAQGVPITTARVFEYGRVLGDVDFSRLPVEHRYILSLPQSETIAILRENLKTYPSVHLIEGMEFLDCREEAGCVLVRLQDKESSAFSEFRAPYLVGCDGHRSRVRASAGIHFRGRHYAPRFLMADFEDHTAFGAEARLYFGPGGSVESFPLSNGRRRWIIQNLDPAGAEPAEIGKSVAREVGRRTGFDLSTSRVSFESAFHPQRRMAATYAKGRILLCGDAAHVMSPIGGQGMNTGFADAACLAGAIAGAMAAPREARALFSAYTCDRQRAFRVAATRAACGMWLGTRTGTVLSGLRRLFIRKILLQSPARERLAPYFAMLTIPGNRQPAGVATP